ncbi:MAG: hypothetical protein JNM14_10140 [Ferruginibacter sp.]|nr:hypothetical protein [Ferruginibacter sp.]
MNEDVKYILAMSCVLPAIAGIFRLSAIDKKFHAFIYMMILVALLETWIYLGIKFPNLGSLSRLPINIYMLLNLALFLFFVYNNGYLGKRKLQLLLLSAVVVAIFDCIYYRSVYNLFLYLLCFVSVVMLVTCIDILSKQITEVRYKLTDNFWFWFSSASILYNAFNFLIFGVLVFSLMKTKKGQSIADIQHLSNAFSYLLFTVAILKIPKKDT